MRFRVGLAILFLLSFTSCKCKDQKEIDNWKFVAGYDTKCPIFGAFPLFVKNQLPKTWKDPKGKEHKTAYEKPLKEAIARWNKEGAALGIPKFFVLYDEALVKKYRPKKAPAEWPVLLLLRDAPKSDQGFGKTCELMRIGKGTILDNLAMAYTEFRQVVRSGKKMVVGGRVTICLDKYERGRRLMATPAAQKLRIMGMYGVMLHELGHALIGKEHLKLYGEIMRSKPENHAISYQLRELLRQRVAEVCIKNGLVSRPASP